MCIEQSAKPPSPSTGLTTRALNETTNVTKTPHHVGYPKRPSRTSAAAAAPPSKRPASSKSSNGPSGRPFAPTKPQHVKRPSAVGAAQPTPNTHVQTSPQPKHKKHQQHNDKQPSSKPKTFSSGMPSVDSSKACPSSESDARKAPAVGKDDVGQSHAGKELSQQQKVTQPPSATSSSTSNVTDTDSEMDVDTDADTTCTESISTATPPTTPTACVKSSISVKQVIKTTAILDWDDTICPSTHLASLGMRVDDPSALPPPLQRQLEQLEYAVINIVEEALRFGNVVVITNAEAGWVELSGRRFLPRVVSFLAKHEIKIVSARSSFESDYPDAPSSWKMAAFSQEVAVMFPDEDHLNLLVLGDSMSERDAAHALSTRLPNSRVKTVKFVERPSIDQLMRQVQLVAQSLPDLATYASSFDVDLVVSASS